MKNYSLFALFITGMIFLVSCKEGNQTLSLHPQNPHYFLFRGKPAVLVGSTEHYGAVLNSDFDYIRYLDELSKNHLNVTRTFSGFYLEPQGAFGIEKNTLAPGEGKLICPWKRSNEPGYNGGGNKFDLTSWDEEYFKRLKDFVSEAGKRNIVVELDLFSNIYDSLQWMLSPLYIANNVNGIGNINDHREILSLRHPEILELQEKMVRMIITELNSFDNLYYEVCNEPYFGDLDTLESWEQHMTGVIYDAENSLANRHLISQNIGNGSEKIEKPNERVSIFNFHYAKPPVTVGMNYEHNRVIGDNETGFNGIEDVNYRTEAWDFLAAGGGLFDNLDYSFTVGTEDGTFTIPQGQPGGGGPALRSQLCLLKDIIDGLDYIHMKPSDKLAVLEPEGKATARVLALEGQEYLVYINNFNQTNSNYSLRYTGFITANKSGQYQFATYSDDGVKLRIGEKALINNWTTHAATRDSAFSELKAGISCPFLLEFFQGTGGAELMINWKVPGGKEEEIPISAFKAADGKTPGLTVEKFSGTDLTKKKGEMVVSRIDAVGMPSGGNGTGGEHTLSLKVPDGNYLLVLIKPESGGRDTLLLKGIGEAGIKLPLSLEGDDLAIVVRRKD
jgi:hypothetical protein